MKKKGFTLIELLAVIVILAIIALIATPLILGVIEKAKIGAAVESAKLYLNAVENTISLGMIDENVKLNIPDDNILELGRNNDELNKIRVSGALPQYVKLKIENNRITEGNFCFNDYSIVYKNEKVELSDKDYCGISNVKKLDIKTTDVTIEKGETIKIEYEVEPKNSKVKFESSDENIATVSNDGIIKCINPGTAQITVNAGLHSKKVSIIVENKKGGLIEYLSDNEIENDKVSSVELNGETYSIHTYSFDGNQVWNNNQTFGNAEDVATETEYAKNMVVVKVNGDLTIGENATITTYASENGFGGPKGFLLYVTGTLINNGTITMTARGAKAEGQNVYLFKNSDKTFEMVPANGALGAVKVTAPATGKSDGLKGENGNNRQTGGGGSGSAWYDSSTSGSGSAGTSYSGGSGGGAISRTTSGIVGGSAQINGGAGGNAATPAMNNMASGGAGNPGGKGSYYGSVSPVNNGQNGTGGLLIIYADTFINNKTISSNGSNGGTGSGANPTGGSSGGGSINIFYNEIAGNYSITASGGISEKNIYGSGGSGGDGSITIGTIADGTFTKNGGKNCSKATITEYTFDYNGNVQEFTPFCTGTYKIEAWGAQGGKSSNNIPGKGAYVSGEIELTDSTNLYVYIGENPTSGYVSFNGGGKAYNGGYDGGTGGGATDIRLVNGSWNDFDSLKSRIMVAGGGGGAAYYASPAGSGGTLIGISGVIDPRLNATYKVATGGTQTSGGISSDCGSGYCMQLKNGEFGIGADASSVAGYRGGGGGGGYYGGGGGASGYSFPGAGGSSFISGHNGCDAIRKDSTSSNIIHTGSPNHYSGYVFTNTKMISGDEQMPTYDGTTTMLGNQRHGYVKITYLGQ